MPKLSGVRLTRRVVDAAQPGQCISDSEVRGFRLVVSASGSRRFLAVYRHGDRKSGTMAIGSYPTLTVEQARDKAREVLAVAKGGTNPQKAAKSLREAPTVAALADYYLGDYATSKPLRASTVRDARDVLKRALPTLGRLKVAEVSTPDIRRMRAKIRSDGIAEAKVEAQDRAEALRSARDAVAAAEQALSAAEREGRKAGTLRLLLTGRRRALARAEGLAARAEAWAQSGRAGIQQANRLLAVLSAMFGLAKADWATRSDNPCEGVRREAEDKRQRDLSEDEIGRLLDAYEAYEVEHDGDAHARGAADAVRLLMFTGARLREALGAEWGQFDLDRGLWVKPSAHTKTKRQHRVELDGPALELLREMHGRRPHARFLFPGDPSKGRLSGGKREVGPSAVKPRVDLSRPWARIVELAGVEDIRLHDLRHATASVMVSGGSSLATVGKVLGHTQGRTTERYARVAATVQRDALREAGERMLAFKGRDRARVVPLTR